MKKYLVMAFLVLVVIILPLAASASSESWVSGGISGGTEVFGHGFSYVQGDVYGNSYSYSLSGYTETAMNAEVRGEAVANHGAAMNQGGASGNSTASESPWGTYTTTSAGSSSNTASVGNASAYQMSGASVYTEAHN